MSGRKHADCRFECAVKQQFRPPSKDIRFTRIGFGRKLVFVDRFKWTPLLLCRVALQSMKVRSTSA